MRAIKFNKFRESFKNLLADMDEGHFNASMGESIIRSLPLTIPQKALLQKDLELMLNYRVRAWNAGVMAERIANGKGWRI